MDHVIGLDQAAAQITARLPAWTASGLNPGPITWRDEAAPLPQPLVALPVETRATYR